MQLLQNTSTKKLSVVGWPVTSQVVMVMEEVSVILIMMMMSSIGMRCVRICTGIVRFWLSASLTDVVAVVVVAAVRDWVNVVVLMMVVVVSKMNVQMVSMWNEVWMKKSMRLGTSLANVMVVTIRYWVDNVVVIRMVVMVMV